MTADVDVCGVGDVPKGDVEENGSYQDPRRENNGVVIISGSNADKEDVDGSYFFFGGSDSVSNDHVESLDLNGVAEVVVVENGECNENNGGGGGGGLEGSECEIKVGQVRGSNGAEEENGSEAVGEFEPQAHPQPQRLEVEAQIKVEESSEDARQIKRSPPVVPDAAESELCKSSMQVHDGGAQDSNLGSTAESELLEIAGEEEDTTPDLSTEGKENHESRDIISMDVQNDFVQEKEATELETNEVPLEDAAQENLVVNMAHSAPSPVAERDRETEVSNTGPVAVENGDGSPINLTQDNSLKSLGANQITAEQNGSSENAESLSSTPFGCGNAVANEITVELDSGEHEVDLEQNSNTEVVSNENGDCLPTDPDQDIISENSVNNESAGAIQSTAEQNGSSQDAESLPSPPFVCANEVTVEADSGKLEAGLEQKTKVIPNQNGNCLPTNHDQAIISEISVHNDLVGTVRSTPEQNSSFQNVDCLHSPVVCGSVLESGESFPTSSNNDTAAKENIENGPAANEIPVEADSGELEVDVQQSSNMEVVSIENGVCIPADDQNGISEISVNNESVGAIQNTPEQNGSSQDVDCLLFPSMSGNKLLENFHTTPNNDTVVKDDTNNGDENGPDYNISSCHASDDAKLETETGSVSIDSDEKVTDFAADALKKGPEVSNLAVDCTDGQPHPVATTDVQCHVNGFVENDLSVKSEAEVESTLTLSSREMPCDDDDDDIKSESKVGVGSANLIESALNCDLDVDGGDQFTGTDSGSKPSYQGAEVVSGINCDETLTPSPEGSTDAFEGQNAEVVKRPFYYLIRLPRYDDEHLREQTTHAQLQVDEKTRNRDAIQAEIQMKRVTLKEYGDNLEAILLEEEAARNLLKSKRKKMDSAQSVINRLKNVIAVKEIDGRIRNMEHTMQHETLPLTEEKQFIREIMQLKQHRAQLSSNIGQQDDVQEALDQKEKTEALLKLLRKELDILRDNVLKAEAVTKTAKKKYNGESEKLKELQARFIAADAIRQEAYAHLQSLKKQFHEKNKHFRKYMDDINAAADLASKVKRDELHRLCVNQVEKVMELWNKNDEFRKEYIRCNTRSTLRRLRTLDGRSLGPGEEPPLIPNVVDERMRKALPPQSAAEQGKQIVQLETEKAKEKPHTVAVEQKKQTTKSKMPVKPAPLGNGLATVSGRKEIEEAREEEPKQTKEEEELARKMEQLRREEEAAKLREQHVLEEKAKAKEALERKKQKAEKAQAKAMFRAQREAEEKEKEREKRARKKERKKAAAGAVEATDGDNKKEAAPSSETPTESLKESETREKPITVTKRSKKPSQFSKQSKAKSIPPPLRNRNKRRMLPWMWVLLTALIVFALFLVGNSSFSFDFGRQRFGF